LLIARFFRRLVGGMGNRNIVTASLKNCFHPGAGVVMIVDYEQSRGATGTGGQGASAVAVWLQIEIESRGSGNDGESNGESGTAVLSGAKRRNSSAVGEHHRSRNCQSQAKAAELTCDRALTLLESIKNLA